MIAIFNLMLKQFHHILLNQLISSGGTVHALLNHVCLRLRPVLAQLLARDDDDDQTEDEEIVEHGEHSELSKEPMRGGEVSENGAD